MKKLFTFAAVLMASVTLMAQTAIFGPFTVTTETNVKDQENAVNGGIAVLSKVFDSGGSNEVTVADQTFYKFSSSTAVKCTLSEGTFEEGDSIEVVVASHASSKKTTGVKLNNSIDVSGEVPGGEAAKFSYIVKAEDGIAGLNNFSIYRYNSDSKFGTVTVFRGGVTPSTDPVTTVTVEGPTNGFVGIPATFTAKTDKAANAYKWYVDGAEQEGETAKTFVLTPSAERTYKVWAAAKNDYNADYVAAASVDFVVAGKLCGELIKAVHKSGKAADVTGVIGGTADKNTQDGGKLGSNGHYFGVKLASGNFMPGDQVVIVASQLNGGNTATIYSDKGENLLGSVDFDVESLTATFTLTSSAEWIYLYRKDSGCNPNVESITVNRSCEASSDNTIAELTVNGVVVPLTPETHKYEYEVSYAYDKENVEVAFRLNHPQATTEKVSPFMMPAPATPGDVNGDNIVVKAEDGTEATWMVFISRAASLSGDWHLKELSIKGYELDPAFDPNTLTYTITIPYSAEFPSAEDITAVTRDPNAQGVEISTNPTNFTILITAENGAQNAYIIWVNRADAKKDLLRVKFSNGAFGFVNYGGEAGKIGVPFMVGEEDPTFVSAEFWKPDGEPTAEMKDGKLVVTGADGKEASYNIQLFGVPVMEKTLEEVEFTTVPAYIASVYGWDADKGVKFSKDVEEATNHRISEGKDRIYLALPAAKGVILTSGSGANRPIEVTVNGEIKSDITKTAAQGETITIPLDATKNNFVGIESKGSNGDGGFIKLQLTDDEPQGFENTQSELKVVKVLRNGQLFILRDGVIYNAQGTVVK